VAHKRADKESWSSSSRARQRFVAKLLREMADELDAAEATPEAPVEKPAPRRRVRPAAVSPRRRRPAA
jgi:hypothetical protein